MQAERKLKKEKKKETGNQRGFDPIKNEGLYALKKKKLDLENGVGRSASDTGYEEEERAQATTLAGFVTKLWECGNPEEEKSFGGPRETGKDREEERLPRRDVLVRT